MKLRAAAYGAGRRARGLCASLALVGLLAGVGAAMGVGRPLDGLRSPRRADRELMAQILDQTGVERSLPEPAWTNYVAQVVQHALAWLLAPLARLASDRALWSQVLAWVILTGLLSVLALLLARWLLRSLRRRQAPAAPAITVLSVALEAEQRATRDRAAWRAEIDRRLAAGQIEAALEAVWWWLARSLIEQTVDPSWTSRELLAAARHRELSPLAATLDRMLYGPARPSVPEVRGFVVRLETALP
jgi:hypothetical protein